MIDLTKLTPAPHGKKWVTEQIFYNAGHWVIFEQWDGNRNPKIGYFHEKEADHDIPLPEHFKTFGKLVKLQTELAEAVRLLGPFAKEGCPVPCPFDCVYCAAARFVEKHK